MVLSALRGGVAFLTRLPVGGDETCWDAFRRTPVVFPLVGYLVGLLAALPLFGPTLLSALPLLPGVPPLPLNAAVAGYLLALYAVTGITHADGLADVGDAFSVHGDADRRTAVLKDSETGVGGTLAVVLVVVALALGALGLPTSGWGALPAVRVVVAAEVAAKTAMALLVCVGSAPHQGLGSQLVEAVDGWWIVPVLTLSLPVVFVPGPAAPSALAAVAAAPLVALGVGWWATRTLGGVSGDVLGTANELTRVVALHAGVVGWTYF
ncbi:cobalamin-5'-phosphate synthase [Halogranum amylolyticum]|uniref:Adenosylcobinamide-GDP ribazoletransferase n=1 Tax=Halogranum amylolyticum TaxID=660520 RepID=A0A1H8W071_9EURY|nr:adenosylcobinamide-GDP ribazoletransferase [Halogranum amylolyticum]SEP20995.1 cobalamin-5'-phosphate synthase [Halogranum amylolyticum]